MARALLLDVIDRLWRSLGARPEGGQEPRGVLLIRSGGLGDLVLFAHVFPRFRALAKAGTPVTVLVRHDAVKTAFLLGADVEIMAIDYGRFARNPIYRWRVSSRLRRRRFRLAVSTDERRHPLIDEAMMAATEAPERLGLEAMPWPKYAAALARNRRLFTGLYALPDRPRHVVEKWAELAGLVSGAPAAAPVLRLDEAGLPPPARLSRPTVVIQPFAAVRRKQLAAADIARLIAALTPAHDIVLTGAAADLERAPEFRDLLAKPRVRFEGASFAEIVPLLRAARLVVSVDTALAHLAAAVGARTLVLASAAWVGEIVPYPAALTPDNVQFLYHDMPCAGCRAACPYPAEDGMYPCVARLDRDLILAKVKELVQQ